MIVPCEGHKISGDSADLESQYLFAQLGELIVHLKILIHSLTALPGGICV